MINQRKNEIEEILSTASGEGLTFDNYHELNILIDNKYPMFLVFDDATGDCGVKLTLVEHCIHDKLKDIIPQNNYFPELNRGIILTTHPEEATLLSVLLLKQNDSIEDTFNAMFEHATQIREIYIQPSPSF